jgi:hypothetical protein
MRPTISLTVSASTIAPSLIRKGYADVLFKN